MRVCIVVVVVALLCARTAEAAFGDFSIGRGKFDVTGPVTQVGFMGYAMLQQTGRGLHFRQFARAFVVRDLHAVGRPLSVYVSIDIGMVFQGLHDEVVRQLATRAPGVFSEASLLLSGTHTHSGPGGFGMHPLYDVTTEGFSPLCFGAIANGTVEAILQAHSSMSTGGRILINQGELLGANANRGAFAYLQNPPEERARFAYDVDKTMVVLRFQDESGAELGAVALFATHGTSMFNNNRLVSGDNKGYASYLFERHMNGWSARAASGPFVAAFGQSNEGDVTPNVRGAFCLFPASVKGQPCDFDHSTCGGRNEGCQGQGPHGLADFENTAAIGELQFHKALELWSNATTTLTPGYMKFAKMYVDMSNVTVRPPFAPSVVSTCPASLGDGFAAGTTDGPGAFDFVQGTNKTSTNPFWNWISHAALADPPAWVRQCQYPKPILLYTQGITWPTQGWTSNVLPLQIMQWGQLVLIAVPGEFTTMSGRRLRATVQQAFVDAGKMLPGMTFAIAGLSNSYSHYITTREEYAVQRYAGASTLFGPHTLEAYQQEYYRLATLVALGKPVPRGPSPPDLRNQTFTFLPPIVEDTAPGERFGSVYAQCNSSYPLGSVVNVTFWGSDLRSNLMTNSSYMTVERLNGSTWSAVLDDADFDTRVYWRRHRLAESLVTCSWHVPPTEGGVVQRGASYRISLSAWRKPLVGALKPYHGQSAVFVIE